MNNLVTVSETDREEFESKCNQFIELGYKLSSSSCGFLNSEEYDFCESYQAILVLQDQENTQ
jgi:hypothetical protein